MKKLYKYFLRIKHKIWIAWFLFWNKFDYKLFVDSNNRNAGFTKEYGASWKKPLTTLDSALRLCAPKTVIFIAPNHIETITNDIVVDKSDITIIGGIFDSSRPTFTIHKKEEKNEDSKTDGE